MRNWLFQFSLIILFIGCATNRVAHLNIQSLESVNKMVCLSSEGKGKFTSTKEEKSGQFSYAMKFDHEKRTMKIEASAMFYPSILLEVIWDEKIESITWIRGLDILKKELRGDLIIFEKLLLKIAKFESHLKELGACDKVEDGIWKCQYQDKEEERITQVRDGLQFEGSFSDFEFKLLLTNLDNSGHFSGIAANLYRRNISNDRQNQLDIKLSAENCL